jgi:hypothetical protein
MLFLIALEEMLFLIALEERVIKKLNHIFLSIQVSIQWLLSICIPSTTTYLQRTLQRI